MLGNTCSGVKTIIFASRMFEINKINKIPWMWKPIFWYMRQNFIDKWSNSKAKTTMVSCCRLLIPLHNASKLKSYFV